MLGLSITSYAQTRFYSQQLDNSSGLSNSCINTTFEDSDHLIWFGTWDGLNVYDGSSFHVFNYSKNITSQSIASNVIYALGEDRKRNIWIATIEGISKYNKNTGQFSHYLYEREKRDKVVEKGFLLAIDLEGSVYCALKSEKFINYFDPVTQAFLKCKAPNLLNEKIVKLFFDRYNKLCVLCESGKLFLFSGVKDSFKLDQIVTDSNKITDIYGVNNHLLYVTAAKELYQSGSENSFKRVGVLPYALRAITYFKNNYILAWSTSGMSELDSSFKSSDVLLKEVPSLKNMRITSLGSQADQMLWVGTDGNGVLKIKEKESYFGLVKALPGGSPINIPIRAFNKVDDGIWVGTKGNGIIQIKNLGTSHVSYSMIRSFHSSLDILDNCVYAIEKSKDDFVYVGSDAPGIRLYDLRTKTWINWDNISESGKYPGFKSVHCIVNDPDGSVWLGSESYGLIHLKLQRNAAGTPHIEYLKTYAYSGNSSGPGNNVIYTIALGTNDRVWVGCRYGGLSLFNKKNQKFYTYKAFSYTGSLSNNDVLSLYLDQRKKLWIGTSYGLNFINESAGSEKTPEFKKITTEQGLPNNTIHAITQDNEGFIWASTNKGLVKINAENLKIVRFKETDGLQSNEFSDNAVWKDERGSLFFGGIYGFNYFLPAKIIPQNYQPNLLLDEIQLAGKKIDESSLKILTSKGKKPVVSYTLAPQDNFFEMKIKVVDFSNFDKCQYAYFLENNDKTWHYLVDNNTISYSNISPGNYTLLVKWSNGDGTWTQAVPALRIQIKQYFWLTWPAFMIYFLLSVAIVFAFYIYRRNKQAMQQSLTMEHLLREKDEKIHQEQLNFFTNIAHELQTPLTLILGALERYFVKIGPNDSKTGNNFLAIVNHQASRLNYLVYQLLEFRKASTGHVKNNYSYLNVSTLFINITQLFHELNDQQKFQFTCVIEPGIQMWIDKDKTEKIIFNLLSNAFKHTLPGQSINVSVHQSSDAESLLLEVTNSGCDLSDHDLHSLFDRFFTVDDVKNNKISTGIGLAFTRELVTLLKGSINVNIIDSRISFKVTLPVLINPNRQERLDEYTDKLEIPSYLLRTVAMGQLKPEREAIAENNKSAMISSVESGNKKSILIIEDEPSIRFLLRDILKETYVIYEAGDGKSALEIVRKIIPNLIVSDIMMPDMGGLEVCQIIKNTPETCHIPFVILSARGTIEQKTEGYEAGADAYIPKPFHAEHLLVRIRKLLEYQQKLHHLFTNEQFATRIPDAGMKENDKLFLQQVIELIERNLEEESLDALFLEEKLGMSKANFYRKLKVLSNMTPGELIKSIRLQQAASFLESSAFTVSEIFYKTGFSNQSHFYREFKKRYHCSPVEYRTQYRLPVA